MPGVNPFGPNPNATPSPAQGGNAMFGIPGGQSQVDTQNGATSAPLPQAAPQELPKGAIGADEKGNPVFGDGITGIVKKWAYNFTKNTKLYNQMFGDPSYNPIENYKNLGKVITQGGTDIEVEDQDWQDLKNRWSQALTTVKREGAANTNRSELFKQEMGLLGETIKTGYKDLSAQGSILSPVLRFTSATVTAIADVFSLPAKATEQALGAATGAREAINQLDSILPRLDQNTFTKGLENTPVGGAYDVARLVLSPSDNKWDEVGRAIVEGWHSGRVLYSQVFDSTLKEKFLAEYRAGGDPQLIAEKLQNPLAELGGQLLLDPLNLVGAFGKAAKTAKELETALQTTKASGLLKTEEGAQALKLLSEAGDERSAVEALNTLVTAQARAVDAVQSGSKLLNVTYDAGSLTTSSRQNALIGKGKELLSNMALLLRQNGMSYDGVGEAILHGVYSVSKNEDEMRAGLSGLAKLPNSNMWLSDDYIETFTMMHKLMADEDGIINGKKLMGLMKATNPADFAETATKLLKAAALQEFPEVGELAKAATLAKEAAKTGGVVSAETLARAQQYEALPYHVKTLDKIDTAFSKVRNPINNVLSKFYFNFQGGVAVKNVVANNELILIDKGVGAWFKDGKYWSTEGVVSYLADVFGELPSSAHGFESLVQAGTGQEAALSLAQLSDAKGLGEKVKLLAGGFKKQGFGLAMSLGEEGAAARVVAASVRDTFETMIPKALNGYFGKAVQEGVMTQAQADKFTKLAMKHGGNLEKAMAEFRDFYNVGAVEKWRNLDFVTDFQRKALDKMGYWQEVEDLARNGAASQADVEKVFQKLADSIDARSELAATDVVGLSADHSGAPAWGDLMKAVDEGHLNPNDQQVFTAIMESAEHARLEYQTLLDDVALKASTALAQEGRMQEAQALGQKMNALRDTLRKAGPATSKEAFDLTQETWKWSDAIKAEKKPTFETLKAYWNKAGLIGEAPLDLNQKGLLQELWKQRFDKVKANWNSAFDAVFAESETVLEQMGGIVDATEVKSMATRARAISEQAQMYRHAAYENGALRMKQQKTVLDLAKDFGIPTANRAGVKKQFTNLNEVPYDIARKAFENQRAANGLEPLKLAEDAGIAIPPPHPLGSDPSYPRAWNESAKGAKFTLDTIKNKIIESIKNGKIDDARQYNPQMEAVLRNAIDQGSARMGEIKAAALKVATEQRNFTLLNYGERTYADVAKSYIMPYHFFYTRSYKNWVSRIATNPEIVAGYAKYKGALEEINKDLPDWYKQQLNINPLAGRVAEGTKLLGMDVSHPLFINLEASLNPLYGLTGTDYNDPAKRTNWATATMDDLGKFGPTLWAPIQMGIAATLYAQGETDAASRWGGRLIPETAQIKSVTSLFGKPIELDPAIQFFSGGIEATDRGRMGYAAAQMLKDGMVNPETNRPYTAEEIQSAFQQQKGAAWNQAYQMAVQSRTTSSITSFFLGVGFKPRGANDVMVEDMYVNLNKLYAMSDMMSGDQYKQAWEQLRSQYPDGLVDTVLLAKKGGDKRDAAYAYGVLGRLPPAEMSQLFKDIGIGEQDVNKFYESKGFTDPNVKYTATEKQRFMAAILDLGAMLKIPDQATRTEWNRVKGDYNTDLEEIAAQVGMPYQKDARGKVISRGVWDMLSHYYDLKDSDKQAADQFEQQHPEVMLAMQLKREAIANSPQLAAYYGGLDVIESFINGKVREELSQQFGREIYQLQTDYYNSDNPKAFKRAHPELQKFLDAKAKLEAENEGLFNTLAMKLPETKPAQFRPDFTPQSGVQSTLYNNLQPKAPIPAWQDIAEPMPNWLQEEIANHAMNGDKLSRRAQNELEFLAGQAGQDAKSFTLQAGLAYQQFVNQPQQIQQPQGAGVNPFGP